MKNIIDKKLLKFILVGILNTLVGTAIMLGLYNLTGAAQQVQENIAMLAGMILFTGFNYLGQRYFVFGEKNEEKTSNRPQV